MKIRQDRDCWVCGSSQRLVTRVLPLYALPERGLEATVPPSEPREAPLAVGDLQVAMCFNCRAELHRHEDEAAMALHRRSIGDIRFRSFDYAVMMLMLAGGFAIATGAGWLSTTGYSIAVLLVLASVPLGLNYYRLARRQQAQLSDRWQSSKPKQAADAFFEKLRQRLDGLDSGLEAQGVTLFSTSTQSGVSANIERGSPIHDKVTQPQFWSPNPT